MEISKGQKSHQKDGRMAYRNGRVSNDSRTQAAYGQNIWADLRDSTVCRPLKSANRGFRPKIGWSANLDGTCAEGGLSNKRLQISTTLEAARKKTHLCLPPVGYRG